MIFNGHTRKNIDELDEATMHELMVMYADGLIGNKGLIVGLGTLTNGVFNYMRPPNSPPYALKSILGNVYSYIYPDKDLSASESLLTFMSQAPEFSVDKFKRK
jgi:hypothetical protein